MTTSSSSSDALRDEGRAPATLRVDGIAKKYGENTVLSLGSQPIEIVPGEIRALVGENGAGKSTFIGIVAGVVAPSGGVMHLNGSPYQPATPAHGAVAGVGAVLQEPITVESMTVADNLLLGRAHHPLSTPWSRRAEAAKVARNVEYPLPLDSPVSLISPEQRKFIELARALDRDPKLLIIDEMTASLGKLGNEVLMRTLRAFAARGGSVIYISHYLEEIFDLCDSITVLKDGRPVATVQSRDVDIDRLTALMVGREMQHDLYGEPPSDVPSGEVVLEVSSLSTHGSLRGIDLAVRKGEIVGIGGLDGSGSGEVGRAIFGDIGRSGGSIRVAGRDVSPRTPIGGMKAGISLLPGDREHEGLHLGQSISRNIALPSLRSLFRGGIGWSKSESRAANGYIGRFSIRSRGGSTTVSDLSGGNRQKVAIARWLLRQDPVIVLENPTRGVDVGAKAEIYGIIREAAASGTAVLLITDELPELIGLSDRILIIRKGRISGTHSRDENVTEEALVSEMVS